MASAGGQLPVPVGRTLPATRVDALRRPSAVDATHAAITSDPETAALAPTWQALLDQADAQAQARP